MESGLLGPRTSLFIGEIMLSASSESLTLILFIPHCATSFSFQLDSWDGTPGFPSMSWKMRQPPGRGSMLAWKNSFAIASTFALLMLSPTTSSLLASSFRPMSVSLGQLLSSSVLHNLLPFRIILGLSCIKACRCHCCQCGYQPQ